MTVFFTADTHFGHANIIGYLNRPWATVDEMSEGLIERWNSVVTPNDTVYHLGDFSMRIHKNEIQDILERLNGNKTLVAGNHDDTATRKADGWYKVYEGSLYVFGDSKTLILRHIPFDDWNTNYKYHAHLHGHTHGGARRPYTQLPNRYDVGVDCWDYYPVTYDQIIERFKK